MQCQIENIFYEEISIHYGQYLFVLLVHCSYCMMLKILFFLCLMENPVLKIYFVLARLTLFSLKIMIPGCSCKAKLFLFEIYQFRNNLYYIGFLKKEKAPVQMVYLNFFK